MKLLLAAILALSLAPACGDDDDASPTSTRSATATAVSSRTLAPHPSGPISTNPTYNPGSTGTYSPHPTRGPHPEPGGFPIDRWMLLGVVVGEVGSRQLVFDGSGPIPNVYSADDQPSGDPERANRSGWNCDTHYEYESAPAVDFYIPDGTPILATMDGTATLYAISNVNDFDRYGVDREPYIGNPDRSRAPYSPFPGPSSGLGVYVHLENADFVTEYGHLDIARTANAIPSAAFVDGWSASTNYDEYFHDVPQPPVSTEIARWDVHKGDVIGMSGDTGYSEGPHVHYTVARTGGSPRCPTNEAGYTDGGWLFR